MIGGTILELNLYSWLPVLIMHLSLVASSERSLLLNQHIFDQKKMNREFRHLRDSVPSIANKKVDKLTIINEAVSLIDQLEKQVLLKFQTQGLPKCHQDQSAKLHKSLVTMNSKSFIFGKNYDSDYLSGKRLKRKSYDRNHRNEKNYRRIGKIDHKTDKRMETLKPIENYRKQVVKTFNKRLTLKSRPIDTSTESYRKSYGLYANGKSSNVVNMDCIPNDNKQFEARIKEDLFWILHKKSQKKHKRIEESHSTPLKTNEHTLRGPNFQEKGTQITQSVISSVNDIQSIPREDDFRSNRLNQMKNQLIAKNIVKTVGKSSPKGSTKLKLNCIKANNYNRSERIKSSRSSQKEMPSLPTSLTIVQDLMKSYESERDCLEKTITDFGVDLVTERCDQIEKISKSFKQSIEQNLVQKQNCFNAKKRTIDSSLKSPIVTNNNPNIVSSGDSVPLSVVPYNENEAQKALKQLEPTVGNMLSRLLLNISDAFQTLSSKCTDKSFFE